MVSPPDLTSWLSTIVVIASVVPVILLLIPLTFQIVGLIGVIWYPFLMIKYRHYSYYLANLIKSLVFLLLGTGMNYLLQLLGIS